MSHQVLEASLLNLAAWSLQVGVLALVAAALSRLLPIERPPARLGFAQALLALGLGLPLVQPWRTPLPEVGWSFALTPLGASPSASIGGALSSMVTPAWSTAIAGVLLLGVSVQLARLGVGLFRIRSLRGRARAWDAPPWLLALREELAPRALFLISDETGTPAMCGLWRPVILLPKAFESMDRERQCAIAAHELVHARRGDWLPLILEETLKAVLFFHPAVHWLVGRVRLAREQTVDAAVVQRLGAREVYLESLVEVARIGVRAPAVPAAPFLRENHLRERVDLLLKEVVMSRVRMQVHAGITAAAILLAVSWAVSAAPLQSAPTSSPARTIETARFASIDGGVQVRRAGAPEWIPATRTLVPASPVPAAIQSDEDQAKGTEPKIVHRVTPVYPPEAKADKAEGVVLIEIQIGRDGSVREARVVASVPSGANIQDLERKKGTPEAIQGDPRLSAAALDAVKLWRYEPVLEDGQPVEARLTITINFWLS